MQHEQTLQDGDILKAPPPVVTPPVLLLIATTRWPNAVLLARTFVSVGFSVRLLCAASNPAWNAGVCDCLRWDQRRPLASLENAIGSTRPLLVVPVDDRAASFLRTFLQSADEPTQELIERSVGARTSFEILDSRYAFCDAAKISGLRTPPHACVDRVEDLRHFLRHHPAPCVLKVDGTWGGRGVRFAASHDDAVTSFRALATPEPFKTRAALFEPFWLHDWRRSPSRTISVQSYIEGRPGDVAVFCLKGELKSALLAQAEACWFEMGPTTLLTLRNEKALVDRLKTLVSELKLSGFVGIDLIFPDHGDPFVIEINPRATPLCNIAPSASMNPVHAAARAFLRECSRAIPERADRSLYAHYPAAWQVHAADPRLLLCDEDIPADNTRLVAAVANANCMAKQSRIHHPIAWAARILGV